MRVSIIGSGYVGLVTGMGFVKLGNDVVFVDVDDKKTEMINNAKPPIYEEGLEDLMSQFKDKYYATKDYREAILNSDVTFICVGTPSRKDGSIDLTYIKKASEEIGRALKEKEGYHVVVIKSTVLPGTTEEIVKPILESYSGKKAFEDFGLAMNPEFLREGVALRDFLNPDRIIIGVQDDKTKDVLEKLYVSIDAPKLIVGIKTAEMIKYASNAFLATKISFANEIGNICKKLGIDSWKVFEGVGLDHRISPHFFRTGIGWGGSCFPKDVRALISKAKEIGEEPLILEAVVEVNERQPLKLIELLKKHVPELEGKTIGVLGLAFKPNTDDVRETRAYPVIKKLLEEKAQVIAYDPKAMENFKHAYPDVGAKIQYADSAGQVVEATDVILIVTEWKEFEELDYSGKIVIDGRRIRAAERTAKIYEGACW
ncbi:UDP-glucose/GDP-mannose dehydrogenase family protein [Thermococcus sp. GR7]|uniref:UDP-glucose dehydrogenase family protein n=1 Tax=unclassified Thermococcus TaxID=2627626 RepID=UPI0014309131|nr:MULTISPECIES: UDP-glucose/GDP-mannose dehydrogenase family protein [unclassified Thermococcus]NJE46082.1 UDP-glucose/GDP-mannose dehydrogenase family protein [Thermococcus sp. GR7]NJE78282.1 UDP-glucose/GDP-mannose dehydrogenase family protein [Thermococcus sp. GR4]NJF22279.1 UDP-glucose/GDP-mannose dehydrogenase family protein [Thermococcus sp. GR5]